MREAGAGLWIGNALEARNMGALHDAGIQAIVDLGLEEPPVSPPRELLYFRVPLTDGPGNTPASLQLATRLVTELSAHQIPTLVSCSAGMSRSPAVVAAATSLLGEASLEDALEWIRRTGPCDVSPGLLTDLVAALSLR